MLSLSPEASRLVEAHRLAQARLGAQMVQRALAAWALIDREDLDGSAERWLRVMLPLVAAQRSASAGLAAGYLSAFRALALGPSAFAAVLADAAPDAQVRTSLLVTGPIAVKIHMRTDPFIERAMEVGRTMSARAAMRHALAGGRDTLTLTVQDDPRAAGWRRVTSGKACEFCSMLAGRGAVYGEASVKFHAHDGCSCSGAPVYTT